MHALFAQFTFVWAFRLKQCRHRLLIVANDALEMANMKLLVLATEDARLVILLLTCDFIVDFVSILILFISYKVLN